MSRRGAREERAGWVKAPSVVEAEIRAVWQEDELPDEITQAPGHHPFTLGLEAQEWVDSMAEVVDGGKAVYGRPKPVIPVQHRQLATPSPPSSPPPAAPPPTYPPANYQPAPPPRPRILMPDIDDAPPPPPPKPRVLMPEVTAASPPPQPHPVMPDIDAPPSPPQPRTLMPDIDDAPPPRPRTLPKRVLMPDVGEEEQPRRQKPPSMPEIG